MLARVEPFGRDAAGAALLTALTVRLHRCRRAYTAALEQGTRYLQRERHERARRAQAEERARMARELHDSAAHHLSEVVVQAGAAERRAIDDPDLHQALAEIRDQGATTLTEMRQVIDVLRDDGENGEREPPPSLAWTDELVDHARRDGCQVSLTVEGEHSQPLPGSVDRAAYRVLQEGLANACRHAPGSTVTARLTYAPESLEAEMANTIPTRPAPVPEDDRSHGLAGLCERVSLAGGDLTAGPTAEGGWRVHAILPITLTTHPHRDRARVDKRTDGMTDDSGTARTTSFPGWGWLAH